MNSGSDPDPGLPTFSPKKGWDLDVEACGMIEKGCFEVRAGGITEGGGSVQGEAAGEGGVLLGGELGSSALLRDLIPLPPPHTTSHLQEKGTLNNLNCGYKWHFQDFLGKGQ